jgi:hypothetical protein
MGLVERKFLITQIAPPIDHLLASQLVDEFISMERRFIQRDWEPAELDGGQFGEIAARILYHLDSGTLNYNKGFSECLAYFENNQVVHRLDRRDVGHIANVLHSIYKFRSQRGAVHISPKYTPNHMDAKYVMEAVRWSMNDMLRVFWSGDREEVAKTIRELLQFDVPCVGIFDDIVLVQRTNLTAEQEILILLHYGGEAGFSRGDIGRHSMYSPPAITTALQTLCSAKKRQAVKKADGNYRLTDLGQKRIREEMPDKLLLE